MTYLTRFSSKKLYAVKCTLNPSLLLEYYPKTSADKDREKGLNVGTRVARKNFEVDSDKSTLQST